MTKFEECLSTIVSIEELLDNKKLNANGKSISGKITPQRVYISGTNNGYNINTANINIHGKFNQEPNLEQTKFIHIEGQETQSETDFQHVEGKYNILDTEGKYQHIVGGGISDTERKNIQTLDWQGNQYNLGIISAADFMINNTNVKLSSLSSFVVNDFATTGYVNESITDLSATIDSKNFTTTNYVDNSITGLSATIDSKGYLTEHQSLIGYATTGYVDNSITELSATIDNKNFTTTNYVDNSITDLSATIDSKGYLTEHQSLIGYATTGYVDESITDLYGIVEQSLTGKVDKIEGKSLVADTEIERLSGINNYDDTQIRNLISSKADKSQIPLSTSQLINNSGFLTEHQSLANYATTGYVDNSITDLSATIDSKGYLTEHQSLTGYATTEFVNDSITDLSSTIDSKNFTTTNYVDDSITDLSATIDSKNFTTTEFVNDSITDLSSTIDSKGYLTEHQSLIGYVTTGYVNDSITDLSATIDSKKLNKIEENKVDQIIIGQNNGQVQAAGKTIGKSAFTTSGTNIIVSGSDIEQINGTYYLYDLSETGYNRHWYKNGQTNTWCIYDCAAALEEKGQWCLFNGTVPLNQTLSGAVNPWDGTWYILDQSKTSTIPTVNKISNEYSQNIVATEVGVINAINQSLSGIKSDINQSLSGIKSDINYLSSVIGVISIKLDNIMK